MEKKNFMICTKCHITFINVEFLKLHMEKCHMKSTVSCQKCGIVIKNKKHYKRHLEIHEKRIYYKCEQCGKQYKKAFRTKNIFLYNLYKKIS